MSAVPKKQNKMELRVGETTQFLFIFAELVLTEEENEESARNCWNYLDNLEISFSKTAVFQEVVHVENQDHHRSFSSLSLIRFPKNESVLIFLVLFKFKFKLHFVRVTFIQIYTELIQLQLQKEKKQDIQEVIEIKNIILTNQYSISV